MHLRENNNLMKKFSIIVHCLNKGFEEKRAELTAFRVW